MPFPVQWLLRLLLWLLAVLVLVVLGLMGWGGDLLIATDSMPSHVDAAVVLQGSMVAEMSRLAGAMSLAHRGIADRVLISVPKESYWGQSIPPVARAYIEKNYGHDAAARVEFCETDDRVNSTAQEAEVVLGCVRGHGWQSIAVVTSNYHTRRAGILWRRTAKISDAGIGLSVESVADPEFEKPWWRHRQAAKIWLSESLKLLWTVAGGR